MKKILALLLIALLTFSASANFIWSGGGLVNFNDVLLPASETDPTVGAFVQLIMITNGSVASAFVNSGNGTSGNDIVVQASYLGQGDDLFEPGLGSGFYYFEGASSFYVRVFDAPQATLGDWDSGSLGAPIPVNSQYYFQSHVYSYNFNPLAPTSTDFNISEFGNKTINVVPEPGVLAMMGLGLFGLATVRRRLQS
jgi:hypothetical protein